MKKMLMIAAMLAAAPVHAQQTAADHAAHHPAPAAASPAKSALSDAEVRKVDLDAKKITLRHGPIPNLDMPPMTMVFQVKDPAMLEQVKAGDKVRFSAEKIGGAYTITGIEFPRN
ncbi:MAG: copper-binding protein [Burkholderiales bacterium]|nr:copper-binding protein [Burkholderiales bacterium]